MHGWLTGTIVSQNRIKMRVSSISIHHFEVLVNRFMNKEFGIEELQSRLYTALIPDKFYKEFSNEISELINELELIFYTQLESDHFHLASKLLETFIDFLKKYDC